jgi:hypothetical protein
MLNVPAFPRPNL